MTTLADFSINGTPSVDGNGDRLFVGTAGQTLTCTLENSPAVGVLSTRFDVANPADTEAPLSSRDAPQINWTTPATPSFLLTNINDDALIDLPPSGVHSYVIRCTVSTVDGPVIFERIVSILSTNSLRKTIPAESTQARARGHSDDLNDLVDASVAVVADSTLKAPEAFAAAGTYPVTYDGNAVAKGDTFRMTGAGSMGAVTVNIEDLLIALVDTPGQSDANWQVVESNRDQATETVKGVAELATQAETDAGTNDTNIVTPLKLASFAGLGAGLVFSAGAAKVASYTVLIGEIAKVDPSGGAVVITPTGSPSENDRVGVKNVTDSTNEITFDADDGGKLVDGQLTAVLINPHECQIYQYNGTEWSRVTDALVAGGGGGGVVPDVFDDDVATTVNAVTAVIGSFDTQANDTVAKLRVSVLAQDDTSNLLQSYDYIVQIKRDSGGAVTVDRVKEIDKFEQQVPATKAVTFIVNGNNIDITVLGIAGRTIEWRYQFESIFITLGGG